MGTDQIFFDQLRQACDTLEGKCSQTIKTLEAKGYSVRNKFEHPSLNIALLLLENGQYDAFFSLAKVVFAAHGMRFFQICRGNREFQEFLSGDKGNRKATDPAAELIRATIIARPDSENFDDAFLSCLARLPSDKRPEAVCYMVPVLMIKECEWSMELCSRSEELVALLPDRPGLSQIIVRALQERTENKKIWDDYERRVRPPEELNKLFMFGV